MSTPFPSRQPAPVSWTGKTKTATPILTSHDWRCTRCAKLLGVCRDDRMHLRFTRAHEYFVGFPITATCRGCGTLNERTTPLR